MLHLKTYFSKQKCLHLTNIFVKLWFLLVKCIISIQLQINCFGKTTLLRDIIRQLSDIYRKNVVLIDERCEIAACVNGVPCNDIGCRTDVLDGCNKLTGVYMAVRSLSPQVVAMDEIGGEDDIKAVKYCIKSGCAVIGTAHGSGIYDTDERLAGLFGKNGFKRAVILEKCGEAGKCLDI